MKYPELTFGMNAPVDLPAMAEGVCTAISSAGFFFRFSRRLRREIDSPTGANNSTTGGNGEEVVAIDHSLAIPPWRIDKISRVVMSKAMLGDLLVEWKRIAREDIRKAA